MVKKLLTLLVASVFVFSLAAPVLAQEKVDKTKKEDRWEGIVTILNKDKSTLVVRHIGGNNTRTVSYDSSTEFTSQEHGSKKANTIDISQIKEGDRVICVGTWGKDTVLKARLISKRLTDVSKMP